MPFPLSRLARLFFLGFLAMQKTGGLTFRCICVHCTQITIRKHHAVWCDVKLFSKRKIECMAETKIGEKSF